MAYGVVHRSAGGTEDQYRASIAALHPSDDSLPDGQVLHVAGATNDGWIIVAVHVSQQSWEQFRDGILYATHVRRHRTRIPGPSGGDHVRSPQPGHPLTGVRRCFSAGKSGRGCRFVTAGEPSRRSAAPADPGSGAEVRRGETGEARWLGLRGSGSLGCSPRGAHLRHRGPVPRLDPDGSSRANAIPVASVDRRDPSRRREARSATPSGHRDRPTPRSTMTAAGWAETCANADVGPCIVARRAIGPCHELDRPLATRTKLRPDP